MRPAWPLPSRRVAGAAVLLTLGGGVLVGVATGSSSSATLASATTPRRVIVVPAATPVTVTVTETKTVTQTDTQTVTSTETVTQTQAAAEQPPAAGQAAPTEKVSTPAAPLAKHVWLVALTGHTMDEALADPAPMPYLSGTLRPKGLLLSEYAAVAPGALANLIALISGQQPTADQQAGCAAYADVDAAARTGCVYGKDVETLPSQLAAAGKTWRAYVEDADATQPPDTCHHPAAGGPLEPVMARDPILFFHAIVDTPDCAANIAGIARLAPDAEDADSAPSLSLVIPNACHDGTVAPCTPGTAGGLADADAWLKTQLDPLLASKAYKDDGMVIVTFDAGPDPAKPVGALVLSAAVKAGGTDDGAYDHTGLLRTLDDAFSLDALGAAKDAKAIEVTNPSP